MPEVSATEAARNFADILDAVEHRGEHNDNDKVDVEGGGGLTMIIDAADRPPADSSCPSLLDVGCGIDLTRR